MPNLVDLIQAGEDIRKTGDPRTRDTFPVMMNPVFVFFYITLYLYFVKIAGPRLMMERKPFQIKTLIRVYNLANVLINLRFMWVLLKYTYLPGGRYSLFCQGISVSHDAVETEFFGQFSWYFLIRFVEALDTVFFILRKKFNQVSRLHVIHHTLVAFNAWFWFLFAPEGQHLFGVCMNMFVHIVMSSYYFLSTFGPEVTKYLWWKKYLTLMQISHFLIFIAHICIPLFVDCGFPRRLVPFAVAQVFLVLGLFSNFYYHNYIKRSDKIRNGAAAHVVNGCGLERNNHVKKDN
ncbi:very long chain fatty acid elongase 4-like [Ornithodoros turicata]|uniref:very long chain fatty acid elongase 4-like n=1 Tax=Ornithodoros turicata TaxID=34597 RepID=UPI00313A2AD8